MRTTTSIAARGRTLEPSRTPERGAAAGRPWRKGWGIALALLVLVSSGCAAQFAHHYAGNAELWIGDQAMVQQECQRRGVALYSDRTRILGCTDFARRVIVSVPEPQIIAHEMCHWTLWTESHEACPLPGRPAQ